LTLLAVKGLRVDPTGYLYTKIQRYIDTHTHTTHIYLQLDSRCKAVFIGEAIHEHVAPLLRQWQFQQFYQQRGAHAALDKKNRGIWANPVYIYVYMYIGCSSNSTSSAVHTPPRTRRTEGSGLTRYIYINICIYIYGQLQQLNQQRGAYATLDKKHRGMIPVGEHTRSTEG